MGLNVLYGNILNTAIANVITVLDGFASDPLFADKLVLTFNTAVTPAQYLAALTTLPAFEVRSDEDLKGALGAFSAQTGKIYLTESLVTGDPVQLNAVLLEEIGHYLDFHFNGAIDSAGDEGDIFSRLVRGNSVDAVTLKALKAENDWATITIDGQSIEIEQNVIQLADLTSGSPALLTWADNLNSYQYENVRTIGGGYRARFKTTFLPGPILNLFPNPIPAGIPPSSTVATTINELTSTEKGLLIHTAGSNHVFGGPSPWTPWSTGFSNIPNATNFIQTIALSTTGNTRHIFAEDTYNSTVGTPVNVGILRYTGFGGVKVTLDWTGPASNNLDVYLTNTLGGAPVYTPSFIGTETTVTNDNIEQIFSTAIPAGNYYIYVTKNSTVTTPFIQDFSIFATANNPVNQGHGWGDVHLVNFDGTPQIDLQTVGEFILVKSLIDDFQVQTRQKIYPAIAGTSVNTAFATTIDGYNVVFDTELAVGQELKIDGSTYNLLNGQSLFLGNSKIERTQASVYTLTYAGPDGIIGTSDDDKVTAHDYPGYIDIFVDPADYRFGVLQGLLGNADGVSTNDFALRDGTDLGSNPSLATIHTTWADSWRITQQESLFGTPTFADKSFPSQYASLATLAQANPQAVANGFAKGRAIGIAEGNFLIGGVFDFVATGNEGFLQGAKQAADFVLKNGDGVIQLGSIKGSKWNDANGNGTWDAGEQALAGWTIYIDSVTNGKLDPWELSTVTDANGQYSFTNLGAGEYPIREVNQTGWVQTSPTTPYAVNLTAGKNLTNINFGNRQVNQNFLITPQKDIIDALDGDDTVTGTYANLQTGDNINGGAGTDTLVISGGAVTNTIAINVGSTTNQFNIAGVTIKGFERFNHSSFLGKISFTGSTNNDWIATGAGADTLNGLAGVDTLSGGAGNDILNGGAGKDSLTGGAGNDTHIFQFGQSTVALTDRITDFAFGTDKIDLLTSSGSSTPAPTSFSRAANNTATTLTSVVTSVFADANGALAGPQALGVNSAALVVATNAAIAGTYLVVNDGTAGFQTANDLVVNLTGYTGTLPALGNITPASVFV
jgi:hypothetical protein